MNKFKQLSHNERDRMAILFAKGESISGVARQLNRGKSTISDEYNRHKVWSDRDGKWTYEAIYAQNRAEDSRFKPRKDKKLYTKWLNQKMREGIGKGWSPEQISGRLSKEHPNDYTKNISPEAIYQFIYDKSNKDENLFEYLPRKQKKRRKQKGRFVHKSHIPQRVSISQRPTGANTRELFGHWEGDTVEGKKSVGDGIHTEVERKSRFTMVTKVKAITSQESIEAQIRIFSQLPKESVKSDTLDNGRENHLHFKLKAKFEMDTYFAHPYSSFERGTNENTNGLIRRYYPKGTDFSKVTHEDIEELVYELNNRPRKILQFQTPLEVFTKQISKHRSD
jgi:transposase, IS30 family